jgi:LacI family transcriptional regulator
MSRRRYVSIKEVAARAGVSFQTASKVLNGGDVRVSVETEERILAAAADLGYRPNTIARSLVQRATATIGLVASDATDVAIAQASVAAEQAARENGHSVLVGHLAAGGADAADIVRTLRTPPLPVELIVRDSCGGRARRLPLPGAIDLP